MNLVGEVEGQSVFGAVQRNGEATRFSFQTDRGSGRVPPVNHHMDQAPPRLERTLVFSDMKRKALWCDGAGEIDAQEVAAGISESFAIIEIKRTVTVFAGVDAQS